MLTRAVYQRRKTAHQNRLIPNITQNIIVERLQYSDRNVCSNATEYLIIRLVSWTIMLCEYHMTPCFVKHGGSLFFIGKWSHKKL